MGKRSSNKEDKTYLSIVIPAFNEEGRLPETILKIDSYLRKKKYAAEIIVVDDGSRDNTAAVAQDLIHRVSNLRLLRNATNRGKGYSIRNGFLNSCGKYLLFSDADLSTPIDEIDKLLSHLESGYDISIGSRGLKESHIEIHQPWYRELMGRVFNVLVRALVVPGFKDTQCGFKLFSREAGLEIAKRQTMERFSFDVEMLYIARKHGYKIKEVPVRWLNDPVSKVGALKDSASMFLDLLRIRINDLLGKYK